MDMRQALMLMACYAVTSLAALPPRDGSDVVDCAAVEWKQLPIMRA